MNHTTSQSERFGSHPGLFAAVLLSVLLSSDIEAQTVHVVDSAGGVGSGFLGVQSAIDAADDGDLLLIRAGNYGEHLTLDGKGLVLQAEVGADVMILSITVRNLDPSQITSVRGLDVAAETPFFPIRFIDNEGPIWLEDLHYRDAGILQVDTVVHIDSCKSVVLRNVDMDSRFGSSFNRDATVAARDSEVAIYGCVIHGSQALFEGHPGVSVSDSQVTLYGSEVTGGDGFVGVLSPGIGGNGVEVIGSGATGNSLDLIDTVLRGGTGTAFGVQPGVPGSELAFFGAGGTVSILPFGSHEVSIDGPLRSGEATQVTMTADVGDLVFLLFAPDPTGIAAFGRGIGPLLLPPSAGILPMGIASTPTIVRNLVAPSASLDFLSLYVQSLALGSAPGKHVSFGMPTQVHVLNAVF